MTEVLTTIGLVLGPPLIALASLSIRLRWQAARERRRQDTLCAIASHLPTDGTVEIHDVRDDGSRLQIRVTPAGRR